MHKSRPERWWGVLVLVGVILSAPAKAEPCSAEASAAATEVFEAILAANRQRLPGPAGEAAFVRRVSGLVAERTDFDGVAERCFGQSWEGLDAETREVWAARLREVIEGRYLRRLGSPQGASLEVLGVSGECPRVRIRLRVEHTRAERTKEVEVLAAWRDGRWRALDATVDEASLTRSYLQHFQRAYKRGGVRAVEAELDALHRRFAGGR